jgi:arsenate reductase
MKKVIFACVHNAGRSQIAAAWFNHLRPHPDVHAVSAGTTPAARVHPEVIEAMREVEIDLSSATPQQLTKTLVEGADRLITMGCGEACPYVPGLAVEDWPIEDPKGKPRARVREIRDDIKRRVEQLLLRYT